MPHSFENITAVRAPPRFAQGWPKDFSPEPASFFERLFWRVSRELPSHEIQRALLPPVDPCFVAGMPSFLSKSRRWGVPVQELFPGSPARWQRGWASVCSARKKNQLANRLIGLLMVASTQCLDDEWMKKLIQFTIKGKVPTRRRQHHDGATDDVPLETADF